MKRVPDFLYAETYEGPAEDRYNNGHEMAAPTIRRVQVHVRKGEPYIHPYFFDLAVVPHEPDANTFDELVFEAQREREKREPRAGVKRVGNSWRPYGRVGIYYPPAYLTARQLRNIFVKLEQDRVEAAWELWERLASNEEFCRNPLGGFRKIDEAVKAKRAAIELLGVDRGASGDQIRRSYRKHAVLYHPDLHGDPVKFKRIQEAAERLLEAEACNRSVRR